MKTLVSFSVTSCGVSDDLADAGKIAVPIGGRELVRPDSRNAPWS